MCLVVDCSEKSVKSDYFGVIIYNWWRKVQKIGIFAVQNAYFTKNLHEDPKYSGYSPQEVPNLSILSRIHQKIGIFDGIFPKNWENHSISHKVNLKY